MTHSRNKQMHTFNNHRWPYLACLVAAISSVTIRANAGEAAQSSASRRAPTMEEVIVTAQKREERLIEVPQSATVLSSEMLAKMGATQFRDFANTVPGLNFTTLGAGQNQISLRGVTAGADVSPTVGVYVDDIPYGSSTNFSSSVGLALDLALFDVERIEILRGPQGTLYGASTMGGLLKYTSKLPDGSRFSGDVKTGVSGTDDGGTNYNAAAAINVPLVDDKLAMRASGFYSKDGGFIDNIALGRENVNRSDIYGGRLDFLFTPTDALSVRLSGFAQDIERDGQGAADYLLTGQPRDGDLEQRRVLAESFDQNFRMVSGTIVYQMVFASLTSISSYQSVETSLVNDLSPIYVPLMNNVFLRPYSATSYEPNLTTRKFTQEVRLASSGSTRLEWLIGGFYTDEKSPSNGIVRPYNLAGQQAPLDVYYFRRSAPYEEIAAFGDLTWHFTDKFDVTGGIRYARSELETHLVSSGILGGASQDVPSSTDNVSTYLANARYRVNEHMTAYVRYATGYRPGGPNYTAIDPATGRPIGNTTFESDELKSYEAGFKAETEDRMFGVEVATYYIDWSNIQLQISRNGFGGIINAPGGATVRGAELALTARTDFGLAATGTVGYQDAQLSEANSDLGGADGERLPNVPRYTAALNTDYELPVASSWEPTVGLTVRHVADRTNGFRGRPATYYQLPDYTTVDVRGGLVIGPVNAQLYCSNVFNERGQLSVSITGSIRNAIIQPRTVGISLWRSF